MTRAGIKVAAYFQRARWYDGAIATWYGRRKSPGRGEGGSGLRFDILEDSSMTGDVNTRVFALTLTRAVR